jgi:hypothetical protein
MPLVIEDGTNVAGANSYATRAEIIAYAALRGVTIANDAGTDVFGIKAMDYIEIQDYANSPTYDDQLTAFPRNDETTIPQGMIDAQCEAAMLVSQGIPLLSNVAAGEQSIKRDKTGPLETEYFDAGSYSAQTPRLDALLRPFLVGSGFALSAYRV